MGTDTTTTGTPVQPLDARRILALIALADDLAMPYSIQLLERSLLERSDREAQPLLSLFFDSLSSASRWATWLGVTETRTRTSDDGSISFSHSLIVWHGWSVGIYATTAGSTVQPLDADTRDQLEQVAAVTVDDTAGGV
jgi:hypothetical protein